MIALLLTWTMLLTDPQPRRRAVGPEQLRPESYAVGSNPRAVVTGHFDGDRTLDVAVANANDDTVTVFLGQGNRLRHAATMAAGNEPADLKAADLDRDGDLDLVAANHETSSVTVLLNDGNGSFSPAPYSPLAMGARPHIHSVTAADFDGDGWIDLAVESSDTRSVRLRRGSQGGFSDALSIDVRTMPYYQLGAADVNGDGVADLLIPGHNDRTARGVTRSNTTFALTPWTIGTGATPWIVSGAHVDADARVDVVVLETDAVSVWLNNGSGFTRASWSPVRIAGATGLATGDLDGDGIDDIVVGPWTGSGVTVIGSRTRRPETIESCGRPIGLAIANRTLFIACATENRLLVIPFPR